MSKKLFSFFVVVAILFSACATFAQFDYSEYDPISGEIFADSTSVLEDETFEVYFAVNDSDISSVTAFHLLGGYSDNLEIVDKYFCGDVELTKLTGDFDDNLTDTDKMKEYMISDYTENNIIDYSVFLMKDSPKLTKDNASNRINLLCVEFKALSAGDANIWLDDSYVRTDYPANPEFKKRIDQISLNVKIKKESTPGPAPSGTPSSGTSAQKEIVSFAFKGLAGARVDMNEKYKTINVLLPVGTDVKNLIPIIRFNGKEINPKSGEPTDFTNPVVYTVKAYNDTTVQYTVTVNVMTATGGTDPKDPPVQTSAFSDIDNSHWAYNYINDMFNKKIISGYGEDSNGNPIINPSGLITREEAIKIAVSAYGLELPTDFNLPFSDSNDISDWAKPYVFAGFSHPNKMARGYADDNSFRPKNNVTREELVTMIINTFGFGVSSNADVSKFADADQITWSAPYVAKAVGLGIIVGYEDSTFRPSQAVTRAEAFTMFYRALAIYENLIN